MATSVTSIVNRALDRLGAKAVNDIAIDTGKAAQLANRSFEQLRDAELRKHYWKFAKARISLAPDATAPAFEWDYRYELPNGFLRVFSINEDQNANIPQPEYELEGRYILTDEAAELRLKFIQRISDPNLFDPLFIESFSCQLAWQWCEAITQSNTKKNFLAQEYQAIIREAKRVDSIEEPPRPLEDGSWIESRV